MGECNGTSCRLTAIRQWDHLSQNGGDQLGGDVALAQCPLGVLLTESIWAPCASITSFSGLPSCSSRARKLRCEQTPEQSQLETTFLVFSLSQERVKCSVRASSQCWAVGMRPPSRMGIWHLDTKSCHKIKWMLGRFMGKGGDKV